MSVHGRRVIMPDMTRYPGREHTRADKCQKICDLNICSSCPLFRKNRFSAYYEYCENYFVFDCI